jgi:hypothetical protein
MGASHQTDSRRSAAAKRPAKLYMENTLLRVSGALFCHDPKRAATRTGTIALNNDLAEKRIVIRPDPEYGQPGQLAHKVFVALIKKHSDYGRPIQNQVSFTKREIMRMVGRREWGGRDSEQLSRALHEIHHTFIKTSFKNTSGKFVEHSFNIFPEILIERREFASDPIEACTITLAAPIVASLEEEHFTCLSHSLMLGLGTIGQALYMRLFFHFANLYDGREKSRLSFSKRYEDICAEWLGGLAVHQFKSIIDRDQLGPHLRQLVEAKFLSSYSIDPAQKRGGLILSFKPGRTFFEDYDRFYRKRRRPAVGSGLEQDQEGIAAPLKIAYLFAQKRLGKPESSIGFVSSKEVETAKQLLARVGPEDISSFLDYALAQARSTRFDVQTLGGLKQYVSGYLALRERSGAAQAQESARKVTEREERLREEYDSYRRNQASRILAELPKTARRQIESDARSRVANLAGPLRERMLEVRRRMLTAQRHGDRIKSFEEWKAARRGA